MSERDRETYYATKADPVKYAIYLDRKRREQKARGKRNPSASETARKRRWRERNPELADRGRRANHAVEDALRKGILVRPVTCSKCGGMGKIEGHHPSYAKDQWLVVVWLCQMCHALVHHPRPINSNQTDTW